MNRQAVLASGNAGKLRELGAALQPLHIELLPQSQWNVSEADESAPTFIENALIKARHASAACGLPALADDSGLVVDALQGRPGIRSARFAPGSDGQRPSDEDNVRHLLALMAELPAGQRSARFVCALTWIAAADDPEPVIAIGHWAGEIATAPSGSGGFGYDPVFYCPRAATTAAMLSAEQKRARSHRGAALTQLLDALRRRQPDTDTA